MLQKTLIFCEHCKYAMREDRNSNPIKTYHTTTECPQCGGLATRFLHTYKELTECADSSTNH